MGDIEIYQVDAFTDRPFSGNPAGVCLLESPANGAWMRNVAMEMNLSETAFLFPEKGYFGLRWFTPAVEVDLCGHATLAAAHILFEEGVLEPESEARFSTRSGPLSARRNEGMIELNFPEEPEAETGVTDDLVSAAGVMPLYTGKNRFDYLMELESEEAVRALRPDFRLLRRIGARGLIVTALSSSGDYDFVSRFFSPAVGVDEDPVTGSAHCCLGPFWHKRTGKSLFRARQVSARGGELTVRLHGGRVLLGGKAVTVIRGRIPGE